MQSILNTGHKSIPDAVAANIKEIICHLERKAPCCRIETQVSNEISQYSNIEGSHIKFSRRMQSYMACFQLLVPSCTPPCLCHCQQHIRSLLLLGTCMHSHYTQLVALELVPSCTPSCWCHCHQIFIGHLHALASHTAGCTGTLEMPRSKEDLMCCWQWPARWRCRSGPVPVQLGTSASAARDQCQCSWGPVPVQPAVSNVSACKG